MSSYDEMPPTEDQIAVRRGVAPFAMVPEWIVFHPDLSDRAVRLYAVMYRYADNDSKVAYPARTRLARQLGCSVLTIDRAIKELVEAKAMSKEVRRSPAGDWTSSLYTLRHNPPAGTIARSAADVPDPKPKDMSKARPQQKKGGGLTGAATP